MRRESVFRGLVASLLAWCLAGSAAAAARAQDATATMAASLDGRVPAYLEEFATPGAAVALIRNGEIAVSRGYGRADAAGEVPVTPETGFNVGSISKTVTAWGVMRLVEDGEIELDAPVSWYLTRWRLPDSEFDPDGVTPRRLMSHTAGLSLSGYPGWGPDDALPTRDSLRQATFDTILATVDQAFFDPDHLGIDWEAVGERYRARLAAVESDADFLRLMTRMLREIPASHMDLLTDRSGGSAAGTGHGDPEPLLEWFELTDRPGRWMARVRSFGGLDPARIAAMMADLADSEAVILDVRGNEGGDISFLDLAGRFIGGPVVVGGLVSRGWLEVTGHSLDEPAPLGTFPRMGAPYTVDRLFEVLGSSGAVAFEAGSESPYEGCVALLIDRETGSSAEAFTMAMKRQADARLIGETTAGALLSSREFELPNGWRLRVPVAVGVDGEGRIFWDVPIEPDAPVDSSTDAAVEVALEAVEACAGT